VGSSNRRTTKDGNRKGLRSQKKSVNKAYQPFNAGGKIESFAGTVSATPLPTRFKTKLRYASSITSSTTATTGVAALVRLWNLGSLYDPDATGFGHFPYGFDQLKVLYYKYLVTGVRFKILVHSIGGTAEVGVHAQLVNGDGYVTLVGDSFDVCVEKSDVTTVLVSPSGHTRIAELSGYCDNAMILGVTPAELRSDVALYSASTAANPTLSPLLQVVCSSPTGTASEEVTCSILLEYECELFEPVTLAQST